MTTIWYMAHYPSGEVIPRAIEKTEGDILHLHYGASRGINMLELRKGKYHEYFPTHKEAVESVKTYYKQREESARKYWEQEAAEYAAVLKMFEEKQP